MADQTGDDYRYSGRGLDDATYSGAYGRGAAGETDAPSAGGGVGAGYDAGGTEIARPDSEGGPAGEERSAAGGNAADVDGTSDRPGTSDQGDGGRGADR